MNSPVQRARWLASVLVAGFMPAAIGSPTEAAFEPCRRIATVTLERCLAEQATHQNRVCWDQSSEHFRTCAAQIRNEHSELFREQRATRARQIERQREGSATP